MNQRTCIVTKKKAEQRNLLRFFADEGFLRFDDPKSNKKGEGRGGYVVRDAESIKKLPKLVGKVSFLLKKKVKIEESEIKRGVELLLITTS